MFELEFKLIKENREFSYFEEHHHRLLQNHPSKLKSLPNPRDELHEDFLQENDPVESRNSRSMAGDSYHFGWRAN